MQGIYPDSFEQKVGFDRVRELVAGRCLCPIGLQHVESVQFSTDYSLISTWLAQVDEMKSICLMEEGFPVDHFYDLTPSLRKIAAQGAWLDESELLKLRTSLETIRALLSFFKKFTDRYPAIWELAKNVAYYPTVVERINALLDKFGRIKDNASPQLAQIRSAITSKQSSVSKLVQTILRSARDQGIIEQDASPSVREGRVVIPVAAANKRKLKGIVHDESSTGKTVFIEPVEVVELNNEIRELEYDERREVVRILVEFSDSIRPYLPELLGAYDFMGMVDFIRAKALFAIEYQGAKPIIKETTGTYLRQAKHPLLQLSLKREGKEIVPLDIELKSEERILLISGPNAGGKSVCLKTVGLLQYMLQCGFLPCVLENSEMGLYRKIFIDIGDEQSLENDLSTYSSHLLNMKYFLKNATPETLILIDEFGSGTEPSAGGAIAEAILQGFANAGTYGVITTHYSNLKHFAASTRGIVNGAMLFDSSRIEPLFKLEIGKPGSSYAFEIARKIGLPDSIINEATAKVGDDYVTFEKHLREISRDKRYWEKKRESIRLASKKAEAEEAQLTRELEELASQRKEILAAAKKNAQELLAETNRKIENTIRIIKESNAQKEETRKARQELEQFKQQVDEAAHNLNDEVERKMERIKQKQEKRALHRKAKEPAASSRTEPVASPPLTIGDRVKIIGSDLLGEVVGLSGQNVSVAVGNLISMVNLERVQRISTAEYRNANKAVTQPQVGTGFDTYKRRLNFKSDIDIRGARADEALETVQNLVDDAVMLGFGRVRILHGKGNGILRSVIRDYLKSTPGVKAFSDEQEEFGGAGITVVDLDV